MTTDEAYTSLDAYVPPLFALAQNYLACIPSAIGENGLRLWDAIEPFTNHAELDGTGALAAADNGDAIAAAAMVAPARVADLVATTAALRDVAALPPAGDGDARSAALNAFTVAAMKLRPLLEHGA